MTYFKILNAQERERRKDVQVLCATFFTIGLLIGMLVQSALSHCLEPKAIASEKHMQSGE